MIRLPSITLAIAACPGFAIAAPDTVDQPFAMTAGQVFAPDQFGGVSSSIVQPDGKVIFGSNEMQATVGGNPLQIPLIRFNPDGSVDSTFGADNAAGGGGRGIVYFSPGFSEVHALALQADGKIIAAGVMEGYSSDGTTITHGGMSIVRFNADGTPDGTFRTRGTQQANGLNYINDVEVQPDGKILAAGGFGGVRNADNTYFNKRGLVRFNTDGTVDTSFTAEPSVIISSFVRDVELAPDGKIYLCTGERLNPDGSLDTTFSPQFSPAPPADTLFFSVDLDADGRVLFAGISYATNTSVVQRFFPDGTKDSSFTWDASIAGATSEQLEETPDGKYYFVTNSAGSRDRLLRINADGSLDPTFNALSDHPDAPLSPGKGYFGNVSISPDGSVYSGAFFSSVNGISTKKVVKFEGDAVPGATGTISAPTAISVVEENSTLNVAITRASGITGAASVDYTIIGQTATAGADFTAGSGTLTWAAGTGGAKFISIPVLADSLTEANETFRVTLGNVTGATLGSRDETIVTILDDDSLPIITSVPTAGVIVPGQDIRLSVNGSSARAISYQWKRNGVEILGATSRNFTGTDSALANSGDLYSVVLTNNFGSVESIPISITVTSVDGARDLSYNPTGLGAIQSVLVLSNGQTIVSSKEGNNIRMRRVLADGSLDPTFNLLFTRITFGGAIATATRELPSGALSISGQFDTVNGLSLPAASSQTIRITPQGTVDPRPVQNAAFTDASGRYYLHEANGLQAGIRRYSAAGVLDPGFISSLGAGSNSSPSIFEDNMERLVVYSEVLVGRFFSRNMERLRGDGSRDLDFNRIPLTVRPSTILPLEDGRILYAEGNDLKMVDPNGNSVPGFQSPAGPSRIYSGLYEYAGSFFAWGNEVGGNPFLLRIRHDGSIDPSFPPAGQPNGLISRVTAAPAGGLIVAGAFSRFNDGASPGLIKLAVDDQAVRFSNMVLEVFENEGTIQVPLIRSGSADSSLSVTVNSVADSANSPAHFTAVNETVSWAAGESGEKIVTVALIDDADPNGKREFLLEIAGTPQPLPLRIGILDDESGPVITSQPISAVTVLNRQTRLEVDLASLSGTTFQWFRDGVAISGADMAFYNTAIEGPYQVEVTRGGMTTRSHIASVRVIPDPTLQNFAFSMSALPSDFDVRVVEAAPDGGVWVGGKSPSGSQHLYRFLANGSQVTLPLFLAGTVNSVFVQPDGKTLVGGLFTITGQSAQNIIRLNADNSIDTTFATATGTGPNGEVTAIAVSRDGHIAVGGVFSAWNGTGTGNLTRNLKVLKSDGSVESNFTTTSTPSTGIKSLLALPDNSFALSGIGSDLRRYSPTGQQIFQTGLPVNAIAMAANGDLIVGMAATRSLNSVTGTVGRITQAGVLEQIYPVPGVVNTVGVQADGKILAGGAFSSTTGNRLVRITTEGTLDPLFVVAQFSNSFSATAVNSLDIMSNGNIWIGGNILGFNGGKRVALLNGDTLKFSISKQPVSQFAAAGQPVSLSVETIGTPVLSYLWFKDGQPLELETGSTLTIASLTEADEGSYRCDIVTALGSFNSSSAFIGLLGAPKIRTAPGPVETADGFRVVFAVDAYGVGELSYRWSRNGIPLSDNVTYQGTHSNVLVVSNVAASDAGDFTVNVSGELGSIVSDPTELTVFLNQGALADGFEQPVAFSGSILTIAPLPDGSALLGGSFFNLRDSENRTSGSNIVLIKADGAIASTTALTTNSTVDKIIRMADGKFLVAGRFTSVNEETRNQIARLNADLTLDPAFDPGTAFPGFREVYDLAIDSDGKIMVALNDNTAKYLVRLNSDGTQDTSFVSAANNIVRRVIPQSDGSYILGGFFSDWDGSGPSTDSFLVRINSNGTLNPAIDYLQSGTSVSSLFERPDGTLIAGTNSQRLQALGADGTSNPSFFANLEPNSFMETYAEDNSGDIYFGGSFTTINGATQNRLIKLKPGTPEPSIETRFDIGSGFNGAVRAVALADNGELWVGGDFTQFNGSSTVKYITRLRNESQPPTGPQTFSAYMDGFTLPAGQEGFGANPDLDDYDNGIEYLLGGNPAVFDHSLIAPAQIQAGAALGLADTNGYLTLSIRVREELGGLDWAVRATGDLDFPSGQDAVQVGQPVTADGFSTYLFRCPWPISDPRGKGFLRLEIAE